MKKHIRKRYEHPEELTDEEMGNITFASHMSYLTNKRLHDLLVMCDFNSISAGTTLQLPHINAYRSSLWAIYVVVESVLKEKQLDLITERFRAYDKKRFGKNPHPETRFNMFTMLSDIHRLIYTSMQENGSYFFRMETHPTKGMRRTMLKLGWLDKDGKVRKLAKK